MSNNYGSSWSYSYTSSGYDILSVAIDDSGNYVFAVTTSSTILKSNNQGGSWETASVNVGTPASVACSSDCSFVLIGGSGGLAVSSNFGSSFSTTLEGNFSSVAMSVDATRMVATYAGQHIYVSAGSYGATWNAYSENVTGWWTSISMSDDGLKIVASQGTSGPVYTSSNGGLTWTAESSLPSGNIVGVSVNPTGTYFAGAGSNSYVYTAFRYIQAPGAPDLADGSDMGYSNTDNVTNLTTPQIVVTCSGEGNTVELLWDNAVQGSAMCGGDGLATITNFESGAARAWSFTARETDGTLVSNESSATIITTEFTQPTIGSGALSPVNIAAESVDFSFSTGDPTTTSIEYGITSGEYTSGSVSDFEAGLSYDHTLNLSGLSSDTLYYYRIIVTDEAGNTNEVTGNFYSGGISGCMDSMASNYNPQATQDDASCSYDVYGCMDSMANNYNPSASMDDASCTYDSVPAVYFNGAVDGDWNNLANWWADSGFTQQATVLPNSSSDVIISAPVTSNSGDEPTVNTLTFNDSNYIYTLNIPITVVNGATFNGNSYLGESATLIGSVTFNDQTFNQGTIIDGNANVYYPATYPLGGTVTSGMINYFGYMFGCTDVSADNYDSGANYEDGSCTYTIYGCMDSMANNYDPSASMDDASCTYDSVPAVYFNGVADGDWNNLANWWADSGFTQQATVLPNSSSDVIISASITGNDGMEPTVNSLTFNTGGYLGIYVTALNGATFNGSSYLGDAILSGNAIFNDNSYNTTGTINGDVSVYYPSSNPIAGTVNGNVTYYGYPVYGCTDSGANNYDPSADTDDASCTYDVYGCTDPAALNYNDLANTDDGSCMAIVNGCTDMGAQNYNADANTEDGSCEYGVSGCTDSGANNYDPSADNDDGSCTYNGCTDSSAVNYSSNASFDDGSCEYLPGALSAPVFATSSDSGYSDTDNITNPTSLTFTVSDCDGANGNVVKLYANGTALSTTATCVGAETTITIPVGELSQGDINGDYAFYVTQTSNVGESLGGPTTTVTIRQTGPEILDIDVTNSTETSATITWSTNTLANSQVEYGLDTNYGNFEENASYVSSHEINLSNLSANTTYYYRIISTDEAGNSSASADYSFDTLTSTPSSPVLSSESDSGVLGDNITNQASPTFIVEGCVNGATVQLAVNGGFGDYSAFTYCVDGSALLVPSSDLPDGEYVIQTNQIYNNITSELSDPRAITIDTTPVSQTSISTSGIASTTADVVVSTDANAIVSVLYGLNTSYGNVVEQVSGEDYTTSHTVRLSELTASTVYHYQVFSTDEAGNETVSTDRTFTTDSAGSDFGSEGNNGGGGGEGDNEPSGQTVSAPSSPTLSVSSDLGQSNSDALTSDTTPTLQGSVTTASAAIKIYQNDNFIGTTESNVDGDWTFTTSELTDGEYTFTVTQTVSSTESSLSTGLTITVDTTAPTATLSSESDDTVLDAFNVNLFFSNDVYGLSLDDIATLNATLSDLTQIDPSTYTFTATPDANGVVTLKLNDSTVFDIAENTNALDSNILSRTASSIGQQVSNSSSGGFSSTQTVGGDNFTSGSVSGSNSRGNSNISENKSIISKIVDVIKDIFVGSKKDEISKSNNRDTSNAGDSSKPQSGLFTQKQMFTTPQGVPFTFTKTLSLGAGTIDSVAVGGTNNSTSNSDIKKLQVFLNSTGFTVAKKGDGSVGRETNKFGPATRSALLKFQKAVGIKGANGVFGPATRAYVNGIIQSTLKGVGR